MVGNLVIRRGDIRDEKSVTVSANITTNIDDLTKADIHGESGNDAKTEIMP